MSDRIPFSTLVESHRAALNYAEPYVGPSIGGNISPTGQGFMIIAIPHMRRRIPMAGLANPMTRAQNGRHTRSTPSPLATSLTPKIPPRSDHRTVWRRTTSRVQRTREVPFAGNGDFIPDIFDMPYEHTFLPCPMIAARASYMAMESRIQLADATLHAPLKDAAHRAPLAEARRAQLAVATQGPRPDPLEPTTPPPQLGPETMVAELAAIAVARFRGARTTAHRAHAMPPRSSNGHVVTTVRDGKWCVGGLGWTSRSSARLS